MSVSYDKQTLDNPNPIARYAHRARFSHSKDISISFLQEESIMLDYGCGQGRFLSEINYELKRNGTHCNLYGYDPYMPSKYDGYEIVANPDLITDDTVNLVTCLEVCEHLDDTETRDFINFTKRKLTDGGMLLVTVPIMIGLALPIKELNRIFLHRRLPDIGFYDLLLASLFGMVPPRAENIKSSHRGYDWRTTLQILQGEFSIERIQFSPIRFFGWYGNSQAIMVFRKNQPPHQTITSKK